MLINPNIRAIKVSYEPASKSGTLPTTTFKTLDPSLKVGDFVVVPTDTRHNLTVCKVEEVDVEVNFDDPTQIKWIVSAVDTVAHNAIIQEEFKWVEQIKKADTRKRREELKDSMLSMYKDDGIDAMPIATLSANSAPALTLSKKASEKEIDINDLPF